jgi:hypothetical protein
VAVLVGAAITRLATTAVPLAPVLGGGVAGYLGAGSRPLQSLGLLSRAAICYVVVLSALSGSLGVDVEAETG